MLVLTVLQCVKGVAIWAGIVRVYQTEQSRRLKAERAATNKQGMWQFTRIRGTQCRTPTGLYEHVGEDQTRTEAWFNYCDSQELLFYEVAQGRLTANCSTEICQRVPTAQGSWRTSLQGKLHRHPAKNAGRGAGKFAHRSSWRKLLQSSSQSISLVAWHQPKCWRPCLKMSGVPDTRKAWHRTPATHAAPE